MKLPSMKTFYLVGAGCMFLVVIFNLWNLIANWNFMNLPSKLSFIFGSLFFQLIIAGIFIVVYKATPPPMIENKELEKLIDEYENKNNL